MKAGTEWLFELLRRCPDCTMPPVKELHFFDLRHSFPFGRPVENPDVWWKQRIANLSPSYDDARAKLIEVSALRTTDDYAAYLARFENRAYGEITPSYALLPLQGFREMDGLFPDARFIFIMRDPVDRFWSQVRYDVGRSARFRDGSVSSPPELERRTKIALSYQGKARSSYEVTIANLESVVNRERILYLFYESMFTSEAVENIGRFLDIPLLENMSFDLKERFNVSLPAEMNPVLRERVRDALAPTYEFVEQRFGRPPGWMY